jgi:hypothetical protein
MHQGFVAKMLIPEQSIEASSFRGEKCIKKKFEPLLDLTGSWRGLGAETPHHCSHLDAKNTIPPLNSKIVQTKPSPGLTMWGCMGTPRALQASHRLRTWAHNLMQDIASSYSSKKKFNTSPAQAWPCGLARKNQIKNLSSQSDARYNILLLKKKTFNTGYG